MAEPSYASSVAQSIGQRDDAEDAQDSLYNNFRREGDVSLAGGAGPGYGGYGMPSYGGGPTGVMPQKDGGFEEYLAHHLGETEFDGRSGTHIQEAKNGPFKGKTQGEIFETLRDQYANLPDNERQQWESKTFMQNDRRPGEHLFQYPSQEKAWGANEPSFQDMARPGQLQGRGGMPNYNSDPQAGWNPGTMNADYTSNRGRDVAGSQPISAATGTDFSGINRGGTSQVGAQSTPDLGVNGSYANRSAGQPTPPNIIAHPDYSVTQAKPVLDSAGNLRTMGNSADTAQFGTRLSGGNGSPVTAYNAPAPNRIAPLVGGPAASPTGTPAVQPSTGMSFPGVQVPQPSFNTPPTPTNFTFNRPNASPAYSPQSAAGGLPMPGFAQPQPSTAEALGQFIGGAPRATGQAIGTGARDIGQFAASAGQTAIDYGTATRHALVGAARGIGSAAVGAGNAVVGAGQDFARGLGEGYRGPQVMPSFNQPAQPPMPRPAIPPAPAYAAVGR